MNISLFSIVAVSILLFTGASVIIFLTKSLLKAVGFTVPKLALPNIKEKRAELLLKKRIYELTLQRGSKEFLMADPTVVFGNYDFITLFGSIELIPLLSKLHHVYFETSLEFIEGNRIHFDRLGVLEALFSEKQSLLEALGAVLKTERKILTSKNKDSKTWALTEVQKQKTELIESLESNAAELKSELATFLRMLSSDLKNAHSTLH